MKTLGRVSLSVLMMSVVIPVSAAERLEPTLRTVIADQHPLEAAPDLGYVVRDGRIQVVIVTTEGRASTLADALTSRGAKFVLVERGRIQAFVSPSLLTELDHHPDVLLVERPLYAELPEPRLRAAPEALKLLAVTSEGLDEMNAAAWHAAGFTGEGVKVGVIDLEFGNLDDLLGVELPAAPATTYRSFGGAQSSPDQVHGTACAEIVHDIAPDAELYLAEIRTGNDLSAALNWMTDQGVSVVTMSVGFYGAGPGDGTGSLVDDITAFSIASDALFVTSAGNDRRSHWQGSTADADGNGWVDFAPGDDLNELSFTMSAGDRVAVNIVWNDWSSPTSDYSLHLFRIDGAEPEEVRVSDRAQTGQSFQQPYESITYTAPDGGRFGVRIGRTDVVGTHDMELFSLDSDLVNWVGDGSVTLPADGEVVVAAAAVNYNPPYLVRSYSSAGPANGPGGSLTGGAVKPDLSGYDGVSTASYGTRGFFGTSAASPHVAGAAALIRGADPTLDVASTRAFLEARAPDLGAAGKDNDTGWGRVFLGAAPGSSCTFGVDPTQLAMPPAGGGGLIRVSTDEGCPWTATSLVPWINIAPPSSSGPGNVGYVVDPNDGAQTRVGELIIADTTVVVTQSGIPTVGTTMVAGIAETEGLGATRWRSNLAIHNPTSSVALAELDYRYESSVSSGTVSIPAGGLIVLDNAAGDFFAAPDSVGAVEVRSSTELVVTARTFNDAPEGTFGQFLPGVTPADGLSGDDVGVLAQLRSSDDFRTNIGFVDVGGAGASARVRLFDSSGSQVGSQLVIAVGAGRTTQQTRVFRAAGAGDCSECYALVDVVGSGTVWAYASVVDGGSGDPTTIPVTVLDDGGGSGNHRYLVAGVAEVEGANQTRWRSNLAVLNLAGEAGIVNLHYLSNGGDADSTVTLLDGEQRELEDAAAEFFGLPDTAGAVEVAANVPLVVTARTFNDAPEGTFGQFLPGVDESGTLSSGSTGIISQLESSESFRTNIGFTNFSGADCTVRVRLMAADGSQLGAKFVSVPSGGWAQQNRIFADTGAGAVAPGYALVDVMTGGCRVWAYGSVVDNGSGDPTTVPVVVR